VCEQDVERQANQEGVSPIATIKQVNVFGFAKMEWRSENA